MAYHNLASKLDRALVAYLIREQAGAADNCYPGKRSLDRDDGIIVATSTLEIPDGDYYTGNRIATTSIIVRTIPENDGDDAAAAAERRAEADALMAGVVDAMTKHGGGDSSLLCDAINAAAWAAATGEDADLLQFSVIGIVPMGETQGFDEEGVWNDAMKYKIHCCPSNVA